MLVEMKGIQGHMVLAAGSVFKFKSRVVARHGTV
jgi:hypothetical protein